MKHRAVLHAGLVTDHVVSYEDDRYISSEDTAKEEVIAAYAAAGQTVSADELTVAYYDEAPLPAVHLPPTVFPPMPPTDTERLQGLERLLDVLAADPNLSPATKTAIAAVRRGN